MRQTSAAERQLPDQRGVLHNERPLIVVAARDLGQDLLQAPAGDWIVRREVGASEERGTVGGEEHGQGVAVQAGERLDRRLVMLCDVRPLVAVHAHRHEEGVDQRPEGTVGVDLTVHLRAPAALVRSHVEQHRTIEPAGQRECVPSPRLPADRLSRGAREVSGGRLSHLVRERSPLRHAGEGEQGEGEERPGAHGLRNIPWWTGLRSG